MFRQSDIFKKGKRPDCRFYLDSLRQLPTAGYSFYFNPRSTSQCGGACFGLFLHHSSSRNDSNPYSRAIRMMISLPNASQQIRWQACLGDPVDSGIHGQTADLGRIDETNSACF